MNDMITTDGVLEFAGGKIGIIDPRIVHIQH